MIYKICYVIAQVLLYFAILEWITYRTVQKNKYCRKNLQWNAHAVRRNIDDYNG